MFFKAFMPPVWFYYCISDYSLGFSLSALYGYLSDWIAEDHWKLFVEFFAHAAV